MGGISEAEFAEVYLGRARAMRRTAYLLCGDWHRAEDLVQSAFARLYAAWPSIRDSGAVDAYLRKTLVRIYIDESRRAWHRERPSETIPDSAAAVSGDVEDSIVLRQALDSVPAGNAPASCSASSTTAPSRPRPTRSAARSARSRATPRGAWSPCAPSCPPNSSPSPSLSPQGASCERRPPDPRPAHPRGRPGATVRRRRRVRHLATARGCATAAGSPVAPRSRSAPAPSSAPPS